MRGKYKLPNHYIHPKYCDLWSFGNESVQLNGHIENAPYQGFGRYVCQLQRVTLKFCKWGIGSKGTRDYIETELVDYCRTNPGVVVYLKPRRHKAPVMVCEYLNGSYHWMALHGMSSEHIKLWVDFHTKRSGEPIRKFVKDVRTAWPSIQGAWNPFLNTPSEINVTPLPNEERGKHIPLKISATEQLLRMQAEGKLQNILFGNEE